MDDLILQINMLRSQKFNTTLNGTDSMVLNNRVYPFQWENGMFVRLPFPANVTFFDCDGIKPEVARVMTPLKNRFAARPFNVTQMTCPLHVRIIECNHYEGKFTRTVLEFTSPCLDAPVYKYIINKTGLRSNLRLNFLDMNLVFQFRNVAFLRGQARVQAYQEYRLLRPHHHPLFVPAKRYKRQNSTETSMLLRGSRLNPTQIMALQTEALVLLKNNYESQMGIFNLTEQDGFYRSRNETFPRKTRQARHHPVPKHHGSRKTMNLFDGGDVPNLRHPHFWWKDSAIKKTEKILTRMVGAGNLPRLRKMLWDKMQEDLMTKVLRKRKAHKKLESGPKSSGKSSRESANVAPKKGRRRQLKERYPTARRHSLRTHPARRLQFADWWTRNAARPAIQQILANEPYKLNMCQRVCTSWGYYPSWNFCLRVCGIKYNFLSNIQDDPTAVNLYPRVRFVRIARQRLYLPAGRENNQQFTYDEIQRLANAVNVFTCNKTWRTFNCQWNV